MLEDYYKNPQNYEVHVFRNDRISEMCDMVDVYHKSGWFLLGAITVTGNESGNLGYCIATMLRKKK